MWQAGTEMLRDFPVTGAGFGTFREVFPQYLPPGALSRWAHAHNDYLEVLLDGGGVALFLLLWLVWGYASRVVQVLRRSAPISPGHLGMVLGVVSLAIHASMDFNHQIPANALLFVTMGALILTDPSQWSAEDES